MNRGTITLLKSGIYLIGIVLLVLCIFWLPWLAGEASIMNPEYAYLRYPVLIGLYVTAIPFFLALYQALKLLDYIKTKNAFSDLAVGKLNHIKHYAIIITLFYISGGFGLFLQSALHPGIAIIGIVIIFASLTISLFAALLQELLRNALEIKSENDLMI